MTSKEILVALLGTCTIVVAVVLTVAIMNTNGCA